MDSTVALVVSPAAGLVGVGVGYVGSRRISKAERAADARAELRRAVAGYLAALYPVVAELRAMPDVRTSQLAEVLDRVSGEAATYVRSRRQIAKLGSRPFELGDRLAAAAANLQVLGPPEPLDAAVAKANGYVEQLAETRSDEVKARWPEIWDELHSAVTALPS